MKDALLTLVWLFVIGGVIFHFRQGRRRRAPTTPAAAYRWPEHEFFDVEVVGESHYQEALQRLVGRPSLEACLTPQTANPHDRNAVAVTIDGQMVGYLSRDDAPLFRDRLAAHGLGLQPTLCSASIEGGHRLPDGSIASLGVRLALEAIE